jgi:hypothetical protein
MLAKLVADAANHTDTLVGELLHQARYLLSVFEQWQAAGRCIRVVNPECGEDVFTDRWPGSVREQAAFIADLKDLVQKVAQLAAGCDLPTMRAIMASLFGEAPTGDVFKAFTERAGAAIGAGRSYHQPGPGRFAAAPSLALSAPTPLVRATRSHTFFGAGRDR